MINKEEKSMFEGEKMSFVIIGATLLLSFIIMYFCKAVTSNSDNGVDISNLKVAQNKAEEYYFERQYEKAIAEYIKQGEGQEWPINKVKIAEIYSVMGETDKSNNLLEESVINRYTLIDSNKMDDYAKDDQELTNAVLFTFFENGEYQKALEYGELFLKEDKTNSKLQRTMLAIYMANGKKDQAKEMVENYNLDKSSSYDLATYARMYMLIDEWDKGFKYLKEAWELNKDEIKVFDVIQQITAYENIDVVKKIKKLEKDNPNELCYKVWLAKYYSMSKNTVEEAKKYLEELKGKDIGQVAFKTVEARIYQYLGQDIEAKKIIEGLINNEENSYIGFNAAAWYYEEEGDINKAIEYCSKSIALNREYADNYIFLTLDIFGNDKNKDKEKVEPYIRVGLEKEPFNYSMLIKIADYYANEVKNTEQASNYYSKASILKPDEPEIYYEMAKLDFNEKEYMEAAEKLKKSIELNDSSVAYHRALGTVYYYLEEKEDTIKEIRKAYALDENDIKTLNNAGCYYMTFESSIGRAVINFEAAYEGLTNKIDKEIRTIINDNHEKAQFVYDQYTNYNGSKITMPKFELFY